MEWLDRLSAKKGTVGIELQTEGFAIVAKGCFTDVKRIDAMAIIHDAVEPSVLREQIESFCTKHKVSKRLCHLVLAPKDYNLLLVEAPDVPEQELPEALKWRIKDLISMPVDQAVLDVFRLPQDANRSGKKMVYAVVAARARIQQLVELINEAGLTLSSIDIGEMAMRNISLVAAADSQARGVGIARITAGGGVVSLFREGNLYLSRQFQLNYSGGLLDDLPVESLALEVQRSLDYYERQMGLAPPAVLYFCGESVSADKITLELQRSINIPAKYLDIHQHLALAEDDDEGMTQMCIGALGGVYREAVAE